MHPACPVILVKRRNRIIPRMFDRQGIKTPLRVPNFFKLDFLGPEVMDSDEESTLTGRPFESMETVVALDAESPSHSNTLREGLLRYLIALAKL